MWLSISGLCCSNKNFIFQTTNWKWLHKVSTTDIYSKYQLRGKSCTSFPTRKLFDEHFNYAMTSKNPILLLVISTLQICLYGTPKQWASLQLANIEVWQKDLNENFHWTLHFASWFRYENSILLCEIFDKNTRLQWQSMWKILWKATIKLLCKRCHMNSTNSNNCFTLNHLSYNQSEPHCFSK